MTDSVWHDHYQPRPIDTTEVIIPGILAGLTEALAMNAHDVWAAQRLRAGWRYGPARSDAEKLHPCLVPYGDLPDEEKEYDRNLVKETIRSILALGYEILPKRTNGTAEARA
jgi:hypothetical protein